MTFDFKTGAKKYTLGYAVEVTEENIGEIVEHLNWGDGGGVMMLDWTEGDRQAMAYIEVAFEVGDVLLFNEDGRWVGTAASARDREIQ